VSGAPAGTMSFAMVFVDTTIINASMTDQRGYHSAIWDIPATGDGASRKSSRGRDDPRAQ
jgi:phosphatidylethanolamine-binding protein (PEBP) family uncharacterized protein